MGLFGKKKKEEFPDFRQSIPYLPTTPEDIPPLPPLRKPNLKEQLGIEGELPPLPPMPEFTEAEELPPLPKKLFLPPKERALSPLPLKRPAFPSLPKLPEMPSFHKAESVEQVAPAREPGHVFVRLDKYNSILKAIGNMESKINELRNTIAKINSIKDKENEIIEGWAALLQEAKTRVDEVSRKLPDVERA